MSHDVNDDIFNHFLKYILVTYIYARFLPILFDSQWYF